MNLFSISLFLFPFPCSLTVLLVEQENPAPPGEGRFMLKILVPNSQAGSIIGKAGSKIKETQETTGGQPPLLLLFLQSRSRSGHPNECTISPFPFLSFLSFLFFSAVKILLSEEPLPGSTERSMTLSGTNQGIHDATLIILRQLASVCPPSKRSCFHQSFFSFFFFSTS